VKKSVVAYIFLILGVVLVSAYLIFSSFAFNLNEDQIKCRNLEISIDAKVKLLSVQEIHNVLEEIGIHPIGVSVNRLNTEEIERFIEQNPIVKKANCYHTPEGNAYLDVILREPMFVVVGNENYYVDADRQILPVPAGVSAYVPLVTGRVTKSFATGKLYNFVEFVRNSKFWNAQIGQIHINDAGRIELVPRVGNTIIYLGKTEKYEDKLDRLYKLYSKGFAVFGWDMYSMLDLQFDNQIVAIKNKNK
jgi:cell division protein FtsQ